MSSDESRTARKPSGQDDKSAAPEGSSSRVQDAPPAPQTPSTYETPRTHEKEPPSSSKGAAPQEPGHGGGEIPELSSNAEILIEIYRLLYAYALRNAEVEAEMFRETDSWIQVFMHERAAAGRVAHGIRDVTTMFDLEMAITYP